MLEAERGLGTQYKLYNIYVPTYWKYIFQTITVLAYTTATTQIEPNRIPRKNVDQIRIQTQVNL